MWYRLEYFFILRLLMVLTEHVSAGINKLLQYGHMSLVTEKDERKQLSKITQFRMTIPLLCSAREASSWHL